MTPRISESRKHIPHDARKHNFSLRYSYRDAWNYHFDERNYLAIPVRIILTIISFLINGSVPPRFEPIHEGTNGIIIYLCAPATRVHIIEVVSVRRGYLASRSLKVKLLRSLAGNLTTP